MDLRVGLRPLSALSAHLSEPPEASAAVRERVLEARERSGKRWADQGWLTNAEVPGPALRREFALPPQVTALLDRALERGAITARGADRCLRIAWTLADLKGADKPEADEVAAALNFRERSSG